MIAPFDVLAPGKLVLVGEYAVLDGAPAIVLAIDRGVRCEVRPGHGLETPDGDTRFVAPALEGAPPARYRFTTWNPVSLPGKPGFGGSAAACVAACLAAGRPGTDATEIHRRVQGGGSGIDVAASLQGGQLRFQAGVATPAGPPAPVVVIWSGRSARTGERIAAYRAWARRAPGEHQRFVDESASLVAAFPAAPLTSLAENGRLLRAMAEAAGLDYWTPELARISALAEACGGAAKPSGAGGGDCAVALLPDPEAERVFERITQDAGLKRIAVRPSPGARRVPPGALQI